MRPLYPYFIISLLLHLLLIFFLKIPDLSLFKNFELAEPIWIDLKKGQYQIADILPPLKEEKPDQTKFLGMYDMKTPEESVATTPMERKRTSAHDPLTMDQKREDKSLSEKSIVHSPLSMVPKSVSPQDFLPEDFYPDFHKGVHTYLNVLRFPDIQYFVRLKKVFKMTFNPISPLREAYFHNQIIGGKIETVLGVAIDSNGDLAEIFVFRESGIHDFDSEALRTIKASAPFSKPPSKLLDKEGLLRMSWTFTVYL